MRSARAADLGIEKKIDATWHIDAPEFTEREQAALDMASKFTENYRDITDQDLDRWRRHFSDEEIIELATFMALADGFGKLVEMFGLGDYAQVSEIEI